MSSLNNWKLLEQRPIVKTKWVSVYEEKLDTGNGVIDPFFAIHYQNWCLVIAITPSKKVLINQQYRRGCDRVIKEFPTGAREEGEDPKSTALRELLEETGYELLNNNENTDIFELYSTLHEDANRNPCVCNAYLMMVKEEPTHKQSLDQHEQILVSKESLQQVRKWCFDGTIQSGLHIAMFFRGIKLLHKLGQVDGAALLFNDEDEL